MCISTNHIDPESSQSQSPLVTVSAKWHQSSLHIVTVECTPHLRTTATPPTTLFYVSESSETPPVDVSDLKAPQMAQGRSSVSMVSVRSPLQYVLRAHPAQGVPIHTGHRFDVKLYHISQLFDTKTMPSVTWYIKNSILLITPRTGLPDPPIWVSAGSARDGLSGCAISRKSIFF